jgi:hypothetical protein
MDRKNSDELLMTDTNLFDDLQELEELDSATPANTKSKSMVESVENINQ